MKMKKRQHLVLTGCLIFLKCILAMLRKQLLIRVCSDHEFRNRESLTHKILKCHWDREKEKQQTNHKTPNLLPPARSQILRIYRYPSQTEIITVSHLNIQKSVPQGLYSLFHLTAWTLLAQIQYRRIKS